MFHRSVDLSNTIANNNPRPLRQVNFAVQNENALNINNNNQFKNSSLSSSIHTPKQPPTKGGSNIARSATTRRAFGDISNSNGITPSAKNGKTQTTATKTTTTTIKKKQSNNHGLSARTPSTTTITKPRHTSSKLQIRSTTTSLSSLTVPSKQKLSSSSSVLPKKPQATKISLTTKISTETESLVNKPRIDPVDDVELPAGRTWLQQERNGDLDSDDDAKDDEYSIDEYRKFSPTGIWERQDENHDYQEYLKEQKELIEQDEKLVEQQIQIVLKEQNCGTYYTS